MIIRIQRLARDEQIAPFPPFQISGHDDGTQHTKTTQNMSLDDVTLKDFYLLGGQLIDGSYDVGRSSERLVPFPLHYRKRPCAEFILSSDVESRSTHHR